MTTRARSAPRSRRRSTPWTSRRAPPRPSAASPQDQDDAFMKLGLAMLAAIAIVFMLLVATFRSLVQPLILLVSIPFAATGRHRPAGRHRHPAGRPGDDRHADAHRHRGDQRDRADRPDQPVQVAGHGRRRGGRRGRPPPSAPDPDDGAGDDLRPAPDGARRHRRGRLHLPAAGGRGDRRSDHLHAADAAAGADALRDGRAPQGAPREEEGGQARGEVRRGAPATAEETASEEPEPAKA